MGGGWDAGMGGGRDGGTGGQGRWETEGQRNPTKEIYIFSSYKLHF